MSQIKKLVVPIVLALFLMSGCNAINDALDVITSSTDEEEEDNKEDKSQENDDKQDEKDDVKVNASQRDKDEGILDKAEDEEEDEDVDEDEKDLTLQITKVDEEAGITLEDDPNYQHLNDLVEANPELGAENDFSLFSIESDGNFNEGVTEVLFLGINRLDDPIKNIQFDFTLGATDGDYVWEEEPVQLPEEVFGAIEPNHAMPILLEVTEEEFEIFNTISEENQIFEMENFTYDTE